MLEELFDNKTSRDVRPGMIDSIHKRLNTHSPRRLGIAGPEAAVLIALTHADIPEIIFTRRSPQLNSHGGEVAFPGGKRDPEDCNLIATALRESHEEIGLPQHRVDILGSTGEVVSRLGIKVTPYIGLIDREEKLIANPDELDRIFRVPVDYFLEGNRQHTDQLRYRGELFQVPSWQYGEYRIWGLTAIMLVEFLNVGLGAGIPLRAPQMVAETIDADDWQR